MSTPQKPHMEKKRKRKEEEGKRVARHATALQISTHQETCTYTHAHRYTNLRLYLKRHHKFEQCCHKAHKYKYGYIMQYNKRQEQQTEGKESSPENCVLKGTYSLSQVPRAVGSDIEGGGQTKERQAGEECCDFMVITLFDFLARALRRTLPKLKCSYKDI